MKETVEKLLGGFGNSAFRVLGTCSISKSTW